MNNNMMKVLAVVVIAGGLWWFMNRGGEAADACAVHADETACTAVVECGWNPAVPASDGGTPDDASDDTAATDAGCATK